MIDKNKSIVVLMDCWEYTEKDPMRTANLRSEMCVNINKFIANRTDSIQVVINACYSPGVLNQEIDTKIGTVFVDATTPEQFAKIYQQHSVDTIWYLGMHWNRCIRSRPLGYAMMQGILDKLTQKSVGLYAKQNCTIELIEYFPGVQHSPTFERFPNFQDDKVTELEHLSDDVYQIIGIKKNWDGKLR